MCLLRSEAEALGARGPARVGGAAGGMNRKGGWDVAIRDGGWTCGAGVTACVGRAEEGVLVYADRRAGPRGVGAVDEADSDMTGESAKVSMTSGDAA